MSSLWTKALFSKFGAASTFGRFKFDVLKTIFLLFQGQGNTKMEEKKKENGLSKTVQLG